LGLSTLATDRIGETVAKSGREIMEFVESYDLTRCAAAFLALAKTR
jgi:hypothetical protein